MKSTTPESGPRTPRDEEVVRLARALRDAERPVRVLAHVAWPGGERERFFARGARELPRPNYPKFDAGPVLEQLAAIRRAFDLGDPVQEWLDRVAFDIELAARMLAATGTKDFFLRSCDLYGAPRQPLLDGSSTPLQLAEQVDSLCEELAGLDLGAPPPMCHLAETVARRLRAACRRMFGPDDQPEVQIVDELSANALAGPTRVRIRRGACFNDRDIVQLVHHEIYVHVATSRNGAHQEDLPVLGASHPGTTRTQEGLAVLAELVAGAMDPDRFRRLGDRVRAIQLAIDGADFFDVYRFFLSRKGEGGEEQAYENARRVFRGGVLTGGAPFTKDIVYLDGLLRVTDFLRTVVADGRLDCLMLLFCGKLDLDDVPALAHAAARGLVRPPRYLPPWIEDRRFLVAYLGYLRFVGEVDAKLARAHYEKMLADVPRLRGWALGRR